MLRPGNVHSAHNWREVLDPIVARYGRTGVRRYFRADAAFAKPEVYEYLEERRLPLRYQASQQRGAAMGDRPSVEEAAGKAAEEAHHLVRRLLVSSGELVRHARRLVFQLAEVVVPREVFRQVLERIGGLHAAPG